MGEPALIERIRDRVPAPEPAVLIGMGDDAAVIEPDRGALTVVSTDGLVEGTHFDLGFSAAGDVGHRALAVNLSDLAAMGAAPRQALLSLTLPPATRLEAFDRLIDAFLALAAHHRVSLVGGNITASPGPLVVDVTVIGAVKRRRVLTRAAARPGDIIYVSGSLGAARAGLEALRAPSDTRGLDEALLAPCVQRYRRPDPRSRLGRSLGHARAARACIDVSDGFGTALQQVAAASRVGARVDAAALPIHPGARAWFTAAGMNPVVAAIAGSDDYELVFTAPPAFRGRLAHVRRLIGDLALTAVGVITRERAVVLDDGGVTVPLPTGFDHFDSSV